MDWIDRLAQRCVSHGDPRAIPWIKRGVALGAVTYVAFVIIFKLRFRDAYVWWIREDGPFETATSVAYLAASVLALHVAGALRRSGRRIDAAFYLLLSIGCFFVAGEEISWGQRILGIRAPEYFREHNYQKEMNLHNLATSRVVHTAYILVSAYGAIASFLVPQVWRARYGDRLSRFIPERFLAPCFLSALLLFSYFEYLSPLVVAHFGTQFGWGKTRFLLAKDQEPAELLLAIGYLAFVAANCLRLARRRELSRARSMFARHLEGSEAGSLAGPVHAARSRGRSEP